MPRLALSNVEVVYDKVFLAIRGVSLEVEEGDIVALLGANGAGKSTTLKTISGLLAPERGAVTRGEVTFGELDLLSMGAPRRVQAGLVHVRAGRRVFGHQTPEVNLIAAFPQGGRRARDTGLRDRAYTASPQ